MHGIYPEEDILETKADLHEVKFEVLDYKGNIVFSNSELCIDDHVYFKSFRDIKPSNIMKMII